jgi:hypothetical protein
MTFVLLEIGVGLDGAAAVITVVVSCKRFEVASHRWSYPGPVLGRTGAPGLRGQGALALLDSVPEHRCESQRLRRPGNLSAVARARFIGDCGGRTGWLPTCVRPRWPRPPLGRKLRRPLRKRHRCPSRGGRVLCGHRRADALHSAGDSPQHTRLCAHEGHCPLLTRKQKPTRKLVSHCCGGVLAMPRLHGYPPEPVSDPLLTAF